MRLDYEILYKSYSNPEKATYAIKIAKERKWLPISINSKRFMTILDIFSWTYGDGHLHKDGLVLLTGQRQDLERLAKKIKGDLKLDCNIVWDPYRGKIKTNTSKDTCRLYLLKGCRPFGRLLMALGAPVGNKVYTEFSIPKWVMEANTNIKKRFLEVFLSNEITVRKLERKRYLPKFEVRMNKSVTIVKGGLHFMSQIKELLNDIGIESLDPRVTNSQGKNSTLSIVVAGDLVNVYKFYKNLNLRYSLKKQRSLELIGKECEKKLKNHLSDIKNYKKTMNLRKLGLGRRKVSRLLNLNVYLVDGWFRRNNKPIFYEREKELENVLEGN